MGNDCKRCSNCKKHRKCLLWMGISELLLENEHMFKPSTPMWSIQEPLATYCVMFEERMKE